MPQQGFHCIVDWVDMPYQQCIDCAATRGRCQFTASLLRGMADQARERRDGTLSVTALTGCTRQSYLQATHDYNRRPAPRGEPPGDRLPDDARGQKAPVPVWPDDQVERFLAKRAPGLADALATSVWPPMTEETWLCRYCPVAEVCESGPT